MYIKPTTYECEHKKDYSKIRNFSNEFIEFLDTLTEKYRNLITLEFKQIIEENNKLENENELLKFELDNFKTNDKYILLEKQNETLINQNDYLKSKKKKKGYNDFTLNNL